MTGITEAGVIVSAGQGLGDKENLDLIYQLAALFTKSAVAGSRIVCDSRLAGIQVSGGGHRCNRFAAGFTLHAAYPGRCSM